MNLTIKAISHSVHDFSHALRRYILISALLIVMHSNNVCGVVQVTLCDIFFSNDFEGNKQSQWG